MKQRLVWGRCARGIAGAGIVLVGVVAIGCVVPPAQQAAPGSYPGQPAAAQQAGGGSVAGTYVAQVGADVHQIVLRDDGGGTFNGQPGTWRWQDGRVLLSDGQMFLQASVAGAQLTLHTPQGDIPFVRQGGVAQAQPPQQQWAGQDQAPQQQWDAPQPGQGARPQWGGNQGHEAARVFAPSATLAGDVVAPEGSGAEFTVPDGWKHGYVRGADGSEVYALARKKGVGEILMTRRPLSAAETRQRPALLLGQAMQALYGNHPVTQVVAPEDIEVAGQRAARAIVRGNAGGQELENYFAGVVAEGYAFVLIGTYRASDADANRAAFDTVLTTFRGSAPPENAALRANLIGCWRSWSGSTDNSNGSYDSSRQKVVLHGDGTYSWSSRMHISVGGAGSATSGSAEQGRFRVEGNSVVTMNDQGEAGSYDVRLEGGMLLLRGSKFTPCGR